VKPLKKFGQNYLTDKNIVRKLISILNIDINDFVIEIGPGKGFITEELCKVTNNLTAIEIDSRVIEDLRSSFPKVNIIHNDFSKFDLAALNRNSKIKIVGNIPFNQTGNILFKLIDNIEIMNSASLIVPFDIAKRIIAKKKTKEYGILTVLFNYFAETRIISKLSKNVFFPKPNIDAAILLIEFCKPLNSVIENSFFIKAVKASFGNRRKTLYNSLSNSIFKNCDFSGLNLPLNKRAEELDLEEYITLTEYLQKQECLKKIK
jgi:16S rRNA (adenine1518-N6/adenine1519-N6)-dimethyltransferase